MWTTEDMETILHPMIASQKEQLVPWEMILLLLFYQDNYRGLHHFFRQNFSQVTNPPIDSLREKSCNESSYKNR